MTGPEQLSIDLADMSRGATLSKCGRYRYELTRWWGPGPLLEWILLNPSIADRYEDDPSTRRCIGFAREWGFNGIRVTNLFAFRATDPAKLLTAADPVGPKNHLYLGKEYGPLTVCGWGSDPAVEKYGIDYWPQLARRSKLVCLGVNSDGSPKHPLYTAAKTGTRPWRLPVKQRPATRQ